MIHSRVETMQGVLVRTGRSDAFIAMGETGQPVFQAALQLIAALQRRNPELARFLAVPQSNEQGTVLDWYSPMPGEVVSWRAATEAEREHARSQLLGFREQIQASAAQLVESAGKRGQGDQVIFGKLLGLVPFCPGEDFLYLVHTDRGLQPVLTFWGFVRNAADRQLDPLYFLTPRPVASAPAPIPAPVAPVEPVTPAPLPPLPAPVPVVTRPWWKRWWWWLLLALLLLALLFGLLRGCAPHVGLPALVGGLPDQPQVDQRVSAPLNAGSTTPLPGATLPGATLPVPEGSRPTTQPADATAGVPDGALPPTDSPPQAPSTEAAEAEKPVQAAEAAVPADGQPAAAEQGTAATPPAIQPDPAEVAPTAGNSPDLSIPADAGDGPADFLNGNYRAGAGLLDAKTAKPLRLEYAFEKGQGTVTIRRPDGVSCTGAVNAAMQQGQLGIQSQDQATCTDGSRYDMPAVNCAPGAQQIADCQGHYGSSQFPIFMRRD